MAERPKGMGRGLAAIMSVAPRDELQELRPIPVDMIDPSPNQPRRAFDEDSLMALAGLHAAAALMHHWVLGDRTLVRMLPRKGARKAWPTPNSEPALSP